MTPRKRFKRDRTLFEWLPNELFLEIFSYLSDVDTVCAFSSLNQRLKCLTLNYCHSFDFKSVSKSKFDYVIRKHDIHRWRSLCLSDENNTPGQVSYFCQLFPFNEYISQLQALSIINAKASTALLFAPQLRSFTQLVSLSLGSVCGKTIPHLELSSLKYLVINSCLHSNWTKNLRLKSLQHTIEHHCIHEHCLTWPTTLKQLKVFLTQSGDNVIVHTALRPLSELTSLTINDSAWENPPPDGQLWEKLIISSMPLLKKFQFYFKFWRDFSLASDIDRIVSKFSTPFYLEEKSWFIQCDSHHQQFSIAVLYSLPFAFQSFEIATHSFDESISTSTENSYRNVQILTVDVRCEKINEELILGNVVDLNLNYSGIPMDWIFSMTHLCRLSLGNQIEMSSKDFIRLLKNTRHLYSLSLPYHRLEFLTNQWKNKTICELLKCKIRSLKICSDGTNRDYVKVEELVPIIQIFHERCRNLNIAVYSRNIVVGLILRTMQRLQSLKVRLKEHGDNLKITREWLIQQDVNFKNLDCSITADDNEYSFWLGCRR